MSKLAVARLIQQRIVGASVLILLGIILIPLILDGEGYYHSLQQQYHLPEQPENTLAFTFSAIPDTPTAPDIAAITAIPLHPKLNSSTNIPLQAEQRSAKHNKTLVNAWVIQLGSFNYKKNAYDLQKKLRKKGYKAFIEQKKLNQQIIYRVKVGPSVDKSHLEKISSEINQFLNTETIITRAY